MKHLFAIFLLTSLVLIQGCSATYTTPPSGVNITALTDDDIAEVLKTEPESSFPARISIVRVQDLGYISRTNSSYGNGNFSVVTARDIESDSDIERVSSLPMVAGLAPLNRLLIPAQLNSMKDLRLSAARFKSDLVLIYSVDSAFHVEGKALGPLSLISLGFLPNKKAYVSSTISGVLVDVRTGFVYGAVEATERESQLATIWNSVDAIEGARVTAERAGFTSFVTEFEGFWKNVVDQYATNKI